MAFLFGPLIAEIGTGVGGVVAEGTGSQIVGGIAGGLAAKTIAEKVNELGYEATVKLFGRQRVDDALKEGHKFAGDISNAAYNLATGDFGSMAYKGRSGNANKAPPAPPPFKLNPSNPSNPSTKSSSTTNTNGLEGTFFFNPQVNGITKQFKSNNNLTAIDSNQSNQSTQSQGPNQSLSNQSLKNQGFFGSSDSNKVEQVELPTNVKNLADNLSNLVINQLKNPENPPIDNSLFSSVNSYYASKAVESLKELEDYQKIAAIYNGKNFTFPFVERHVTSSGIVWFSWFDEVGDHFKMMQNVSNVVWPPVYGYFIGPNSLNRGGYPNPNVYPPGLKVNPDHQGGWDYFDELGILHDSTYSNDNGGSFSYTGDLQFLSRIIQGKDKIDPSINRLVDATLIYFINIGLTLSKWKNSKLTVNTDIIKSPIIDDTSTNAGGDILDALLPDEPDISLSIRNEFFKEVSNQMYQQATEELFKIKREIAFETLLNMEITID